MLLKDLMLTLVLLCSCFLILIGLNRFDISIEVNLIFSSLFLSFMLFRYIKNFAFIQASFVLVLSLLFAFDLYEYTLLSIIGISIGFALHSIFRKSNVQRIKQKWAKSQVR